MIVPQQLLSVSKPTHLSTNAQRSLLELQECNTAASEQHVEAHQHATMMMDKHRSSLAPMHVEPQPSGVRNVPTTRKSMLCDMRERVPASPSDKQNRIMDLRKATLLRAMQQHKQQDPARQPLAPTSVPSPSQQLDPICCSAAVGLGLCAMECASDCESEVSEMRDDYMFAMSDDEVGSVYVVGPRRTQQCTAMAVAV